MDSPWRSQRLVYRAVESPDDDLLFQQFGLDPVSFQNSIAELHRPPSRKSATERQRRCSENALLGVVICIPPVDPQSNPISVGEVHLKAMPHSHHRHTEIGIAILQEYQGNGYGTEAISWVLDWAFNVAGLHRVSIRAFEWNHGARKLYERIGFKHEGIDREEMYHNGRFWDIYRYGMLDREWKEIKAKRVDGKI